jgi:hypothetical protein
MADWKAYKAWIEQQVLGQAPGEYVTAIVVLPPMWEQMQGDADIDIGSPPPPHDWPKGLGWPVAFKPLGDLAMVIVGFLWGAEIALGMYSCHLGVVVSNDTEDVRFVPYNGESGLDLI